MTIDKSLISEAPETEDPRLIGPSLGVVGTVYGYGGDLSGEEYNPNLAPMLWRGYASDKGIADRMMREDSVCAAISMVITKPLESATWTIQDVSTDPRDIEIGDFCRAALFDLPREIWRSRLSQILNFAMVGFHLEEPVYRLQEDGEWKGKIVVDRFAPRLPNTIDEWLMDTEERLQGVAQVNYAGARIPRVLLTSKSGFCGLMRYSFQQLGNNWEGRGLLRALYRPYMMRRDAWRRWAIAVERWSTGIPVMEGVPAALLDSYSSKIETMLQNLRGHGKSWAYTPEGATIKLLGPDPAGGAMVKDLINECATEMAIGTLTMLLMLGRDTGTYNLGEVQRGTLADAFQSIAMQVTEVHNHGQDGTPGILESLVRMNYGQGASIPQLIVTGIADLSPMEVFKVIASGGDTASGFLRSNASDDAFFRDAFNMPAPLEDEPEDEPEPEPPPAPEDLGRKGHRHNLGAQIRPDPNQAFTTWRPLTETERFVDWGTLQAQQDNLTESAGAVVLRHQDTMTRDYLALLEPLIAAQDQKGIEALEVPGVDDLTADLLQIAEQAAEKGYASVASEWRRQIDGLPAFPTQVELMSIGRRVLFQGEDGDDDLPFPGAEPSGTTGASATIDEMPDDLDGQSLRDILTGYSRRVAIWVSTRIAATSVAIGLSQAQAGVVDMPAIEGSLQDLSAPRAISEAGTIATAGFSSGRSVAGAVAQGSDLVASAFYSAVLDLYTCQPCRDTDAKHGEDSGGLNLENGEVERTRPPNYLCKGRDRCRCAQIFVFKTEG